MRQINRAAQDACDAELAQTFVQWYGMSPADAQAAVAAIRAGVLPSAWQPGRVRGNGSGRGGSGVMDEMKRLIKQVQSVSPGMGSDLHAQFGGILRCSVCGYERTLTPMAISLYLSEGWPKHCGYTMRWVTQKELDVE